MPTFSGAGSRGFFWIVPPTGIIDNIHKMRRRTLRECRERFDNRAFDVERWMKDNHPWNNRTYTAEDSLTASTSGEVGDSGAVAPSESEMVMEIGYDLGVLRQHPDGRQRDYSIYLEGYLGLGIIGPTMQRWGPVIMDEFEGAMTL